VMRPSTPPTVAPPPPSYHPTDAPSPSVKTQPTKPHKPIPSALDTTNQRNSNSTGRK
jgi:hypothetical protein